MTSGRRRGGGCWTCRLRRKRCDSVRPVCGSCQDLGIDCYQGESRPPWMDGAAKQKCMSDKINKTIKENAFVRREKRRLAHENQSVITVNGRDLGTYDTTRSALPLHVTNYTGNSTINNVSPRESNEPAVDRSAKPQSVLATTSSTLDLFRQHTVPSADSPLLAGSAMPIDVQLGSVMIYLDYVFPFLFPFYQPPLIETGRQWLLGLLCHNTVSFHVAASLSAHFFTLVPQKYGRDMHDSCKALALSRLIEQMDAALKSIQGTIAAIDNDGAQVPLLDKARLMQEITQLLVVEVTVQKTSDWTMHLTPALVLFDEIFSGHGTDHSGPNLAVLIHSFPSSLPAASPHHKPLPNTADQSALVFFVSLLLFIDLISSTSLVISPVLHSYHRSLLSSQDEGECHVQFDTVVGCQNWALVAIGNISALCAWKRNARRSGNFSAVDLVSLGTPIARALDEGLMDMNIGVTSSQPNEARDSSLHGYYSRHDKAIDETLIAKITRIWALAARIYLSVSLSGWQPNATDIRADVASVLSLVETIESPAQLQSLSWPITVAGCLALLDQEDNFRRIVKHIGQFGGFGTLSTGLRIMETVWSTRNTIDGSSWDIASSLSCLGSPALLV